jgi:hypothetical protein
LQPFGQNGKWILSPPIDLEQSSLLLSSPVIIIIIMHMASKWKSTYREEIVVSLRSCSKS